MKDPVILGKTGWSYERQSIESWLASSRYPICVSRDIQFRVARAFVQTLADGDVWADCSKDPQTGDELLDIRLIPNLCLRAFIDACMEVQPPSAPAGQ